MVIINTELNLIFPAFFLFAKVLKYTDNPKIIIVKKKKIHKIHKNCETAKIKKITKFNKVSKITKIAKFNKVTKLTKFTKIAKRQNSIKSQNS